MEVDNKNKPKRDEYSEEVKRAEEKALEKQIEDIINCLKNLAENNRREMSYNVYTEIWNLIQSIEHDLKEKKEDER